MEKNQEFTVTIEDMNEDGAGVGKCEFQKALRGPFTQRSPAYGGTDTGNPANDQQAEAGGRAELRRLRLPYLPGKGHCRIPAQGRGEHVYSIHA